MNDRSPCIEYRKEVTHSPYTDGEFLCCKFPKFLLDTLSLESERKTGDNENGIICTTK